MLDVEYVQEAWSDVDSETKLGVNDVVHWNVTSYKEEEMTIKLEFERPMQVS